MFGAQKKNKKYIYLNTLRMVAKKKRKTNTNTNDETYLRVCNFLKWEIIKIPRTKHKKKRKNVENLAQVQWPIEVSVCECVNVATGHEAKFKIPQMSFRFLYWIEEEARSAGGLRQLSVKHTKYRNLQRVA